MVFAVSFSQTYNQENRCWVTTANRIFRLYILNNKPSETQCDIVKFIIKVIRKNIIQKKNSIAHGSHYMYDMIRKTMY